MSDNENHLSGPLLMTGQVMESLAGSQCYLCRSRRGDHRIAVQRGCTVLIGLVEVYLIERNDADGTAITFMLCDVCRLLTETR